MDRRHPRLSRHPLRRLALAMVCASLPLAAAGQGPIELPDMGDPTEQVLPPDQEARLGEVFMRQIRQAMTLVADPEVNDYIGNLGDSLVGTGEGGGRAFDFFVVEDPAINAFAGPGGYIGVNTGLISATENESELAAVLAHEAAHVTQRHIARQLQQAENMSLPALAALLAAIVIAGKSGGEVGTAAVAAVTAGTAQLQLNFTRANESEADRVGIQMLADAGYDSHGMPDFFQRLQTSSRYYSRPPEFLSTHPVTENRIAEAEDRASRLGHQGHKDSFEYHLIKARLRVLTEVNPREAQRYFVRSLEGGQFQNEDAMRYGLAVADTAIGRYDDSRRELSGLIKRRGELPLLLSARARNEFAAGNTKEAIRQYRDALAIYPGQYALTLALAETQLRVGDARPARDLLRPLTREHPASAEGFRLLAQAHVALGERVPARQAQAEYEYLSGNLPGAIQQLKLAKKEVKDNFYIASAVDARLAELEALEKEEKQQERERR